MVALLLALVVVGGIVALVLALWRPGQGAPSTGGTPSAAASASSSAAPSAPVETPAPAEQSASAPAEPAASASPGASPEIAACSTAGISVLAVTDKEAYGAGELPKLSITLSNTSDHPCLMNVGTATQSFVITSGTDTWWRSTDCQSESSDQVVQLAAGQTVSSVTPVVWDRTRSSVDTCGSSRPSAPSGYFHLQVSIGGIQAADTGMFELR